MRRLQTIAWYSRLTVARAFWAFGCRTEKAGNSNLCRTRSSRVKIDDVGQILQRASSLSARFLHRQLCVRTPCFHSEIIANQKHMSPPSGDRIVAIQISGNACASGMRRDVAENGFGNFRKRNKSEPLERLSKASKPTRGVSSRVRFSAQTSSANSGVYSRSNSLSEGVPLS